MDAERDRGLDLLALKYLLVQPSDLEPGATFDADGVTWNRTALDIQTGRDECGDYTFERSATLPLPTEIEASSLELVLYMRCGDEVPQGTSVGTIAVTDTAASDSFSATTGTLSAADAEGSTLTYGISGVTATGGTATSVGTYGTLAVNTSTGAYTFTPNATAINAISANTSQTFTVTSSDGMTADWCHLPYEFLAKVSNDIINKVKGVNRVVYDISSKPPATIEWE